MLGVSARFLWTAPVVIGLTIIAATDVSAEDLTMPYACSAHGSSIEVSPSSQVVYRIIGRRSEQPFVACTKGAPACETMMVHRFAIDCGGVTVPWARVAHAATAHAAALPVNLPDGYAPVSSLSGRFVLPALTRSYAHVPPRVSMQDLSPDSVVEASGDQPQSPDGVWVTEVRANVLRAGTNSDAGRLAASLVAVLLMLFAASMVAAGRWRLPLFEFVSTPLAAGRFGTSLARLSQELRPVLDAAMSTIGRVWQHRDAFKSQSTVGDELANAVLMLNARLIEVEFSVAVLGPHLLLRDVLSSEIGAIRGRIGDLERQISRRAPQKTAAIVRTLLRELDRISRIAQSAGQEAGDDQHAHIHEDMPQSVWDAYRILGINPDAAPAIAKKLVDALRMSWHPDHARDEPDRVRREERMKQINAAWDLIKARRVAA